MSVPFPPKQVPKAKDQIKGAKGNPEKESRYTTGTMAAVKGMLSIKADTKAETHNKTQMAAINRAFPSGTPSISAAVFSPINSIKPNSSILALF